MKRLNLLVCALLLLAAPIVLARSDTDSVENLMKAAMEQAKREKKNIYVIFEASW
ncbi:MAG: hypothetical protein WAO58_09750 [Fimbriimonadaceae bacterium]|mgnify:CR=1 FL=1